MFVARFASRDPCISLAAALQLRGIQGVLDAEWAANLRIALSVGDNTLQRAATFRQPL